VRSSGWKVRFANWQRGCIWRFERRSLDCSRDDQFRLARMLGDMLLPDPPERPNTRQLFLESYASLRDGEGLRVRIRAAAELSDSHGSSQPLPAPGRQHFCSSSRAYPWSAMKPWLPRLTGSTRSSQGTRHGGAPNGG
jgi:hypothetical protein